MVAVAPDFSVAVCYSGAMQFELMQQHCDTPSVYKERMDRFGEGYHHMARHVADFKKGFQRLGQQAFF